MLARPRLPRPNAPCQCKCPSALAWPRFQTTDRPPLHLRRSRRETDEPAILARLLGYGEPSGASWPDLPNLVSKGANATLRRVRFLSIDIDGLYQDKAGIRQFDFGVSILDTVQIHRQLKRPLDPKIDLAAHLIKSSHYLVEDPKYGIGRRTSFAFGTCRVTSLRRLRQELKKKTENHNVVLVMHGAATEVSVMKRLDMKLNPVFTIDTTTAVRHLFDRTNLKCLLEEYKIPHRSLHYAGNDAHYILRILLIIAVRHVQAKLRRGQQPDWVPIFEAVARSPGWRSQIEAARLTGLPNIIPGNKERKQMERRRRMLEKMGRRLEKLSRIEAYEKEMECRGVPQRLPDCDSMSPAWADHYTISQYGMLP